MKRYEHLVMAPSRDPSPVIARWRGGDAAVWSYTVSHRMLEIRVHRPGVDDELRIRCEDVRSFRGPMKWPGADFEIDRIDADPIVLRDRGAGFEVVAGVVGAYEAPTPWGWSAGAREGSKVVRIDPIAASQGRIRSWAIDEPRALVEAAAALCRETLDGGDLPTGSPAWRTLRDAFDADAVDASPDVREIVRRWDELVRSEDLEEAPPLDDRSDIIKLGIVTWVVKFLARRFGLLAGSDPIPDFAEWKDRLGQAIEKYVGFYRKT